MTKRMEWEKLLNTKRVSDLISCGRDSKKSQYEDPRNPFERDCDQILYSYPFRRLQDKTQVIPFPEFDFVHTRLTHSLEVATVGRSLGILAGNYIERKGELPSHIEPNYLGDLVAGACLAHDIGNPPFGHSGEDSISDFFNSNNEQSPINIDTVFPEVDFENENMRFLAIRSFVESDEAVMLAKMWYDLSRFEGNANGFRILVNCQDQGINPTLALLGVFSKYPRESYFKGEPLYNEKPKPSRKSQSKYGFFQSEKLIFENLANELGLIENKQGDESNLSWVRHPLTFLMEAADDICYQMIDFEDGCRIGLINYFEPYSLDVKISSKNVQLDNIVPRNVLLELAQIDNGFDIDFFKSLKENLRSELGYLRSRIINVLVHECFKIWEKKYDFIMEGEFDSALIDMIDDSIIIEGLAKMKALIKLKVYNYKPVLESEAAGFEVVGSLLQTFAITSNICVPCGDIKTPRQLKLESLLPEEFRPVDGDEKDLTFDEKHKRYLRIIDYVSGMTDGYAISLYRKIKGISLPNR